MPRKADALDAVKISSRGQSLEMGEVVDIPKRGRKPKQQNVEAEASREVTPEPSPVPVVEQPLEPMIPVKVEAYVVVKTCKAWVNGAMITLNAGRKITDNTFGPGSLSKLKSRGIELKLIE